MAIDGPLIHALETHQPFKLGLFSGYGRILIAVAGYPISTASIPKETIKCMQKQQKKAQNVKCPKITKYNARLHNGIQSASV